MNKKRLKDELYEIIFEADTRIGKVFDILLMIVILLSIALVMLESVNSLEQRFGYLFKFVEWIITIIFTIEYFTRILIVRKPFKYITSFYGVIDFLSIIPTYLVLVLPGATGLMVIRALRLLRIFRILKLPRYTNEASNLIQALKASRAKLSVFIFAVLMLVIIIGTIMYLIEGESNGFNSIPKSIYWAIVTLTTVGYGDLAPQTATGQLLASIVMILGYGIIAVPTGIVTVEFSKMKKNNTLTTQVCPNCIKEGHECDATHCKFCGTVLNEEFSDD